MAAILSTVEPLVTVLLALIVLGERLGAIQLLGGALVLAAVVPATLTAAAAARPASAD
jgi:drug/metabolite transporter (DMT)-like permease